MNVEAAPLTVRLLGPPAAQAGGQPLILNSQKAWALLFYLAATGQLHTRDHLATLLWSESSASDARHSLRSSLYRLRQALRIRNADQVLVGNDEWVGLQLTDDRCDARRFRQLVADGSGRALGEAVALYRGPLLQGFTLADAPLFEEWLRFEETSFSSAYLDALDRLATEAESRQAWAEAIGYVQPIIQVDALAEEAQQRLIRLYLCNGNAGQALRQYQQFETLLRRELGAAPSAQTQALFHEALPQRRGKISVAQTTHRPARGTQTLPFVGRDDLIARLLAIGQDVSAGHSVTVLLQGDGGIGKTRLLDELAGRLSGESLPWIVLQGSCSPFDDLLSYGPILEAFHSAAVGDLGDLLVQPHEAVPDARGRFFYAVLQALRTLAGRAPVLLAIDDLQWANSSTLNLFGLLAMRLRNLPVLLLGTVQRAEAIPALQRLITLGRRRGALHLLSLAPLPLEAVAALLRASGIRSTSVASLAEWLHDRSGGSPFILAEILAQLRAEAILTLASDGWQLDAGRWLRWHATFSLPETTHDLVAWRLANLAPEARQVLDVLAVAGQPLPYALLREMAGVETDQALAALEDLLARRLVVETARETFALPHHLLRETLLHRLSHIRRRTLHRQLAEAVEHQAALWSDFPLRHIALHAVAGEDVHRARRYGLQMLADLPQQYTGAEIVDFLQHLHDLLAPAASPEEMLRLTYALGRLHRSLGNIEAATDWHRQNLDLAHAVDDRPAQAIAHFEMAELALVTADHLAALTTAEAGLAVCAASDGLAALAGRGHRLLGAAMAMEGHDLRAAETHLQEAVVADRNAGNQGDLCATLFELGNIAAQRGALVRALDLYNEAAGVAQASGVHYYLALARNNYAYHSLLLGQPDAARRAVEQGLKLAETYEMLAVLLHLLSTQGELFLYLGEWAAAAESFQRGLALAEELGHLERQAGYRAGLALAARGQHDLQNATTLLEEALALIVDQGYWHLQTRILIWLAETLIRLGRRAEARSRLEAALATARSHGRALLLVDAERLRARLLAESNDWPAADALFAETLKQATDLGFPLEVARTQAAWAESALRHSPTPDAAHALLAEARATFQAHGARADLEALTIPLPL
ncbi:MAG TPA: AAA family ATPase [Anaerolineae bacterium]|nr:AAA family ATPase [Anaerolineae bacterium]